MMICCTACRGTGLAAIGWGACPCCDGSGQEGLGGPIVIGDLVTLRDGRQLRANTAALAAYLEDDRRNITARTHP
jgi:hypothetical protein